MRRTNLVYAGLLGVALVASYLSWTSDAGNDDDPGVVLLEAQTEDIESIHYVSAEMDVLLTAQEDALGRFLTAKVIKEEERIPEPEKKPDPEPEPSPADETGGETGETGGEADETGGPTDGTGEEPAGDDETGAGETGETPEPEPEPEPEPKPEPIREKVVLEFVVGTQGDKLVEKLAPFEAKRELPDVTDDKLEEFGLTDTKASLTVQVAGREAVTFEVGASKFGGKLMYVREPASGKIYVVDAQLLAPLTKADERLLNKRLFGGLPKELTRMKVEADGESVVLEHRNREDPENAIWVVEGASEGDDTADAWLKKFFRLRATGYVQPGDEPAQTVPRFVVGIENTDGDITGIEVLSGDKPDGDQGWYARSPYTRGLVELNASLAEDTAQDVSSVLE